MKKILILLVTLLAFISCDNGDEDDKAKEAETKNNEAIALINSGNYETAKSKFQDVINLGDTDFKERATVGLSFCDMRLGNASLANTNLRTQIITYPNNTNIKALLALINYGLGGTNAYTDAYNFANEVITANAQFALLYDSTINNKDMSLTMAQAKFKLGSVLDAYNIANTLEGGNLDYNTDSPSFTADVSQLLQELSFKYKN